MYAASNRTAQDDAGVIACNVRELLATGDVADGKDAGVRGHEPFVDTNTAPIVFDARRLQIELVDIR